MNIPNYHVFKDASTDLIISEPVLSWKDLIQDTSPWDLSLAPEKNI